MVRRSDEGEAQRRRWTFYEAISVMELEGLGAHIWKGVDAQQYVSKERKSWG